MKRIILIVIGVLLIGGIGGGITYGILKDSQTFGYTSYWYPSGGLLKPITSSWGIGVQRASISDDITASGSFVGDSTASISGAIHFGNLISCDTIDTDATGLLKCGSDATGGGSGMVLHGLLGDEYHSDVLNASVSEGDLIIGNATPKWSELTIGASQSFLMSDGTTAFWADYVDANTTYTAGDNLTLTGTDFDVDDPFAVVHASASGDFSTPSGQLTSASVGTLYATTLNFPDDSVAEADINFTTACATGNHYYLSGTNLACEADDDIPEVGDFDAFSGGTNLTYDTSGNTLNVDDPFVVANASASAEFSTPSGQITSLSATTFYATTLNFPNDSVAEEDIDMNTACTSAQKLYVNGNDFACNADDDVPEVGDFTNLVGGQGIDNNSGTLDLDLTEWDNLVWASGSQTVLTLTADLSGTDPVIEFGSDILRTSASWSIDDAASVSGTFNVGSLKSCDTIDTDANGLFVCGTDATAGGDTAAHGLLNPDVHTDTTIASASIGSLIYGDANTKWGELVVGASSSFITNDGTNTFWLVDPTVASMSITTLWTGTLTEGGIAVLNNDEMDASSELIAIFDDETGSGHIVFDTSPELTTSFTTTGVFAINPGGALTIGDNGDTTVMNSSDWDISATGDLTNIGAITMDGILTVASSTVGFGGNVDFYSTASTSSNFDFNSAGLLINIGDAGTDFTSGGGLNIAGVFALGTDQLWTTVNTGNLMSSHSWQFTTGTVEFDGVVSTSNNWTAYSGVWDLGSATSFEIPNGTALTLNADGQVGTDTTDGQFRYRSNSTDFNLIATQSFSFTISSGSFDLTLPAMKQFLEPATITRYTCGVTAETSKEVEILICSAMTCGNGGSVDGIVTATTAGVADDGTLASASILAGDWVTASVSQGNVSGTPNWLSCTIYYSWNSQ